MLRCLATLCALALVGPEADTVKLRCGRVLTGTIVIDDAHPGGFTIRSWDTGGSLFIRWDQISAAEHARLVNRVAEPKTAEALIDGVRALTAGRDVVGVLVKEDARGLHIKTRDSKAAVQVPKSALLRPHERLPIPESDAYSPDERVDLRAAKVNPRDYAALVDLGHFAASLKLYERARECYQKADAADPSKKAETDELLGRNEILMREAKAAALAAQAKELADAIEFAKALEIARKLLADFGDTAFVKQNPNVVSQIEKRAREYETKRAEFLAKNVPQAYKDRRGALFIQHGVPKLKIAEAMEKAHRIDDDVVAELAKRFKATPDEIHIAWSKRELEPRTVAFGDGTWIVKGGQDGGFDTPAKTTADAFMPVQILGKPLQKREDWWALASLYDRRAFVEAEYAKNSAAVKKEVKLKKCVLCRGEGTHKEVRQGIECECKCLRCHGVKDDEIIVYQ